MVWPMLLLRSALLCIALGALGCATAPLAPRAPTPGTRTLTVATYNVHLDRFADPATVRALTSLDADVVCLQEVSGGWARVLQGSLAARYPHVLVEPGGSSGLAILSRHPLEDRGIIAGERGWHPAWDVVAHTHLGPVQLLHIHLRPVFSGRGDPLRSWIGVEEDHLRQIRLFTRGVEPRMPTLVLGDFNEGPEGAAVRWLERAGFRNALPAYRPGQPTWRMPSPGAQLDATIDHILFDPHLAPLDAWVVPRGRSDHMPVVARFERRSPPSGRTGGEVIAAARRVEAGPARLSLEPQQRLVVEVDRQPHR